MKTSLAELLQVGRPSGFRLYLQSELARRCTANSQYSLRSFALQLGLNHSTLSQLLRGKRALTPRTIASLGERLGLSRTEIDAFVAREKVAGNVVTSRAIRDLTVDTVALLADGSHRALLELTTLAEFIPDSRWIARTLDLTVDEVNTVLSRLTRLGLLEMIEPRRWVDRTGITAISQAGFAQLVVSRLSEQVRRLTAQPASEPDEGLTELPTANLVIKAAQLPALLEFIERLQRTAAEPSSADAQQYQLELNLRLLNPTTQTKEQ